MTENLGQIILKDKTTCDVLRVQGPDAEWADKIEEMLGHKAPMYQWANQSMLRRPLGFGSYFYVVVVDSFPIANIKTMELQGVGILGDVYTRPQYREKGAASQLMKILMDDFKARGGKALYLGTGFGGAPYRMYQKFGFSSVVENSGGMAYFSSGDFAQEYFCEGPAKLQPLGWRHYPTSSALFMAPVPGVVRCAPQQLFGQRNSEGSMVKLLAELQKDAPTCAVVGLQKDNGALVGLAMWDADPLWPSTARVDVFCHPHFWEHGAAMLETVIKSIPPSMRQYIAFGDDQCPQKETVLLNAGFQQSAILSRWILANEKEVDIKQYVKSVN